MQKASILFFDKNNNVNIVISDTAEKCKKYIKNNVIISTKSIDFITDCKVNPNELINYNVIADNIIRI